MSDCMHFPDTVEEFMEQYKMTDAKQVYSNGTEYVPIFRMEQWFEHEKTQLSREGTTSDQPVATDTNVGNNSEIPNSSDCISRQQAIEAVRASYDEILDFKSTGRTVADSVEDILSKLPAAKSEFYWRQFKTRPLTEEEKEMYPNIDRSLDCELPKNGQKILVTVINRECDPVQTDIYYNDSGECHLDSLNEIETEAAAWMPLPEPYKGGAK